MKKASIYIILLFFAVILLSTLIVLIKNNSNLIENRLLGGTEVIPESIVKEKSISNKLAKIKVKSKESEIADFNVMIAKDALTRSTGFMFVEHLPENEGMYFVYDTDSSHGFWMKNCLISLDMIFLDSENNIVSIVKDALPCTSQPCPIYYSEVPYRYVLEVNGGIADKYGIQKGMKVEFEQ